MDERAMYEQPCPACRKPVGFDPYESWPAGFGVPFPCPNCGVRIELEADDVQDESGDYEWMYWFVRTPETVSASSAEPAPDLFKSMGLPAVDVPSGRKP
jgi:endogenous inhibitor of DNA gyrase (YacG/DUF329 family)